MMANEQSSGVSGGASAAQAPLREAYIQRLQDVGLDLPFADHRPAQLPDPMTSGTFDPRVAHELITYLESQRGYSTWQAVATEPSVTFMARLAMVNARPLPYLGDRLPHLQCMLDGMMVELRSWLAQQQIALPCELYAGLFPSGQLNARAVPVPGAGALLLVNSGLMDLIFMLLKTNLATPTRVKGEQPLLTEEQAMLVLAEVFNAYLYGPGSLGAWKLPLLPEERERPLAYVLQRAEQFVLGHEIGHVVLGHISIAGPGKSHRVGDYSPQQESDADRFAADVLLAAHRQDPLWQPRGSFLAGAIMTFFVIADAVETLQEQLGLAEVQRESHPALPDRMNRMAAQLQAALPVPDLMQRASVFASWLYTTLPAVGGCLVLINETMNRPGPYGQSTG